MKKVARFLRTWECPSGLRDGEGQWRVCLSVCEATGHRSFPSVTVAGCGVCGRACSYYRKFELCRICFRACSPQEVPATAALNRRRHDTDPIADDALLSATRALARHERAEMPHSNLKEHIATVLKGEGSADDARARRSTSASRRSCSFSATGDHALAPSMAFAACPPRAAASTCGTIAFRASSADGRVHPEHQPRSHDRHSPSPACRRRAFCEVW